MYDLALLKSFLSKSTYAQYRNFVTDKDFEKELLPILSGFDLWYAQNIEEPTLTDIANLTFTTVPEKNWDYVKKVFETLSTIDSTKSTKILLDRFKTKRLCENISVTAYDISRGAKGLPELLSLIDKLDRPVEDISYVTDDINDILDSVVRTSGLRWRLPSLNRSLGSLRKGDFGFIFARPETGKTTFLASEVTHMVGQLDESRGPVLWFNNEEQGKKVKLRCLEAALGASRDQIIQSPEKAKKAYYECTKGKIKIYDSAVIHRGIVETICKKEMPSLIVFDQIDKLHGFSDDREDLIMGAIYQWSRELAKEHAPVIGICQADGTAEGEKWLYMSHVSNAKTAKQAEADFIIGIGKTHATGYEFMRYINISKNKLIGDMDTDPTLRHAKIEVLLKPEIARFEDIQ